MLVVTNAAAAGACRAESAAVWGHRRHGERVKTADLVYGNSVLGLREHRRGDAYDSDSDEGKFANAGHNCVSWLEAAKGPSPLASVEEIG
jgi:hypothetical protein